MNPTANPNERAAQAAENEFWTLRPDKETRQMVSRAIRKEGGNRKYWIKVAVLELLRSRYGRCKERTS